MSEIKLNKEIFAALENCKDAKEVMALTKSKGIALTEEQAGKVFEFFQDRELTDEELEQIVGGQKISVEVLLATGVIKRAICGSIDKSSN